MINSTYYETASRKYDEEWFYSVPPTHNPLLAADTANPTGIKIGIKIEKA